MVNWLTDVATKALVIQNEFQEYSYNFATIVKDNKLRCYDTTSQ